MWVVVDTACNTSVVSEGWIEKATAVWKAHGYQPVQVHRRTGPYGGLAGEATATMVGKVSWPLIIMAKGIDGEEWATPMACAADTSEVEGNTIFLMRLDMQRQLRIR